MNTYNHHRIIENVVGRLNKIYHSMITDDDLNILKDASDYTDNFISLQKSHFIDDVNYSDIILEDMGPTEILTEDDYYFFHFYYDIKCNDNVIELIRSTKSSYNFKKSINYCEYDRTAIKNEKQFYTLINDFSEVLTGDERYYFLDNNIINFDKSNQSDCVAFLHAMGSQYDEPNNSRKIFIAHLKKCFCEFLFLKDYKEALFILGIGLHSLMDSFTPSHTGFKKYTRQDMAKHAQGDVIPFVNDIVAFDPGQYSNDGAVDGKTKIAARFKGYNSNDVINDIEFEMLKIFIDSYLDKSDSIIASIYDGTGDIYITNYHSTSPYGSDRPVIEKSRSVVNKLLENKKYKDNAYDYSEKAIKVITELFVEMIKKRQKCLNNYEQYKKGKDSIDQLIHDIWEGEYDSVQNIEMYPASDEKLYSKNG